MNEATYSIGPIMKAARKFKKLNQAEVAQAIGCSQSALSKMEHNLLVPSAPQWFLFSRFTSIPPESLEIGFIDRREPIKFNSTEVSLGFKVPKRYRQYKSQKIREIYPFLKNLQLMGREDSLTEFYGLTGLDSEFFLDFDNLVSFNLFVDMVNHYLRIGLNKASDISMIVEKGHDHVYFDHCGRDWKKNQSPLELISEFIKVQPYFQTDFQLRLEGNVLNYYPEFHLKHLGMGQSAEFVEFLNQYRKLSIEHLIRRFTGRKLEATLKIDASSSPLAARFELRF